jgi:DNA-binding CsgD family transcriptional regulator
VLRDITVILVNEGRESEAAEITERALEVAEQAGERTVQLELRALQAWHDMAAGRDGVALRRIAALASSLTDQDGPDIHTFVGIHHADILLKLGRLSDVVATGASPLRKAAEYGMDRSFRTALVRANVAQALVELGDRDAAAALVDSLTEAGPDPVTRIDYSGRAVVEMLRGNLDESRRRAAQLRALPQMAVGFQVENDAWESELLLWCGEPELAYEQTQTLLKQVTQVDQGALSGPLRTFAGPLLTLALRACADLAERARTQRNLKASADAQRDTEELVGLHAVMTPDPFTAGPLRPTATADGATWQAEWSRLRRQSDVALWERAATAWDALSRPHRAAYARWRQAEALLATTDGRAAAAAVVRTAAPQALQHVPLAAAIAELARRARIDLTEPARPGEHDKPPAPTRTFGLTDRELAVLRLLSQGMSNPEIGAALFISPKTASVHVTNILRKLGVTTRVQAATVAERAGLLVADPAPPTS